MTYLLSKIDLVRKVADGSKMIDIMVNLEIKSNEKR